ncbi:serine/threonine protein phosphatase [Brevibacillus borstelensis]|uniref:metallophosphoesterase family protein n=1 Tax=Brevibacillus borstelensis TaxID=45462 RepID=UPI00203DCBA1|nr:metallophosphoesterase family protein [Brevibacillus borstelensis]MCM3624456.1 serine/threonine protein phosphatase [Brevibacillus borstelensis]
MNIYLVSDIHGQYQALREALQRVSFSPERQDSLYVIGDMVDRGPQSKEVLEYLLSLKNAYPEQIFLLKGNHEQMFEDWLKGNMDPTLYLLMNGGDATVRSFLGRQALRRAFLGEVPPSKRKTQRAKIFLPVTRTCSPLSNRCLSTKCCLPMNPPEGSRRCSCTQAFGRASPFPNNVPRTSSGFESRSTIITGEKKWLSSVTRPSPGFPGIPDRALGTTGT